MRRNPNPAITPEMYRHFAIVTVAITGLMAFFANGENQQAAAAAANRGEHRAMPQAAASKPQLEIDPDTSVGTWGEDEGTSIVHPAIGSYASGAAPALNPFGLNRGHRTSAAPSALGDQDSDESGSEEAPEAPSASQIAAAAAASRLRSGARGND
jgi:hypothetical protein